MTDKERLDWLALSPLILGVSLTDFTRDSIKNTWPNKFREVIDKQMAKDRP